MKLLNNKLQLPTKWQDFPSLATLVLYIAFSFTHRLDLPVGISYVLLVLVGAYSLLLLSLLGRTFRHKPSAGVGFKTYLHLSFRLLLNAVLLYLVASSIWAF